MSKKKHKFKHRSKLKMMEIDNLVIGAESPVAGAIDAETLDCAKLYVVSPDHSSVDNVPVPQLLCNLDWIEGNPYASFHAYVEAHGGDVARKAHFVHLLRLAGVPLKNIASHGIDLALPWKEMNVDGRCEVHHAPVAASSKAYAEGIYIEDLCNTQQSILYAIRLYINSPAQVNTPPLCVFRVGLQHEGTERERAALTIALGNAVRVWEVQ